MSLFDKIKDINLVEYATKLYGEPKKQNSNFWFKSWNEKTPSLVVYSDYKKNWYFDYSKNWWWTIIDMCMNYYNITLSESIKKLKEEYNIEDNWVLIKPKTTKRDEILPNFESLRNTWNNNFFNQFLQNRWFDFKFIQDNQEIIDEVAKEFWVAEWVRISKEWDKSIFKNCVLFPCYHYDEWEVKTVWVKIRRLDNEKIWAVKSLALKGWKTGLIYTKEVFESEQIILCEWETDYLVLKALWFRNVIWNLGWVASNVEEIKKITKKANILISFYDNDLAWKKANQDLQIKLNRSVRQINYPQIEWWDKDINDLFKMWYRKKDFQDLIDNACAIEEEIEEDENIIEKKDWYYIQSITKDWSLIEVKVTNFLIKIEDIVLYKNEWWDDEKKLILKIYNNKKETRWEFSARNTTDVKSFNSKVRSLETSFSCYDMKWVALESLMRYIHKNIDIKNTIVVKHQGYIPEFNIWTFENWIFANWVFINYNENKVVDIWDVKIKFSWQWHYSPVWQDDFYFDTNIKKEIIWDFRYMFNWAWWDLVLWYLISSLFVNNLLKDLKPFPVLFVVWKKWSWKTTAVDYALRTLGLEVSAENFETSTDFVDQLDISEVSSLPLWRDEYKNSQKVKRKDWYIKSVFDRNGLSKWTLIWNTLWKNTYPVNASLLLSWEETPNDDAVFSRCCLVNVKQNREWWAEKFEEIKKRIDFYWSVMREILEKNDFLDLVEKYKKIFDETKMYLIKEAWLEKRILNVYLPIISWFIFYEKYILNKKVTADEKEIWLTDIITIIWEKIDSENEQDIINEFFEVLSFLYAEWHHINYSSEFIKTSWNNIQVAFSYLYPYFNEHQRRQGKREIPAKDLKKYLESEFWAKNSTMNIDWRTARSLSLSKLNIPKNLELLIENIENKKF